MIFEDTPSELIELAELVAADLKRDGFSVKSEDPYNQNAPFRTTLLAKKGRESVLVEVQSKPVLGTTIKDLVLWLRHQHEYASFYLAVSDEDDLPSRTLRVLRQNGIGLLLIEHDGTILKIQTAQIFALLVPPSPTVNLGRLKTEVCKLCNKFNNGDRVDALRDLFELVEMETYRLALKAASKNWIDKTVIEMKECNWATKINILAAHDRVANGGNPIIDLTLKDDLISFKGARNLFDHPAKNAQEKNRRELQSKERMIQGPRLLAELLRLQRKVK